MAERKGFEPSIDVTTYNGLANRRLQPLGHPSAREWVITTYAGAVVPSPFAPVNPASQRVEKERSNLGYATGATLPAAEAWHAAG